MSNIMCAFSQSRRLYTKKVGVKREEEEEEEDGAFPDRVHWICDTPSRSQFLLPRLLLQQLLHPPYQVYVQSSISIILNN